jgi:hypothetical protein
MKSLRLVSQKRIEEFFTDKVATPVQALRLLSWRHQYFTCQGRV